MDLWKRGRQILKNIVFILVLLFFVDHLLFVVDRQLFASEDKFGLGIKLGISKLEGDWREPKINPGGSFLMSYNPVPFFSIGSEFYYSNLKTKSDLARIYDGFADSHNFKTTVIPLDLNFNFYFCPYSKYDPFASIGIGGAWWESSYSGNSESTIQINEKDFNLFIKSTAGLEINLNNGLGILFGIDFRYTTSDYLDQIGNGDESDGIISVWSGLKYYFRDNNINDMDGDGIPDQLDLDNIQAEDFDGFLDHDGRPDVGKVLSQENTSPIVIHHPVKITEEEKDLKIKASITSTEPLRTAAVLYRTSGKREWQTSILDQVDDIQFATIIDRSKIHQPGLEYCVVAVNKNVTGIGYSGLPRCPNQIKVVKNGRSWRFVAGIVAVIGWTSAAVVVLRKQNF